jgi:hypothetical protein
MRMRYADYEEMTMSLQESIEELLQVLPIEERLKGVSTEERLKGVPAEERLMGLSPEELEQVRLLLNSRKTLS